MFIYKHVNIFGHQFAETPARQGETEKMKDYAK